MQAEPRTQQAVNLLIVFGSVGAVCVVRELMDPVLGDHVPYVLFLAAVAASTRWAGWKLGIGATLLSLLAATYLFAPPRHELWVSELDEVINAALFMLAAVVIVGALAAERAARRQVEDRDARLEAEFLESQRLHTALAEAHRLESIGRLAGGIAHDFNNLLAVVLGSVQLLRPRAEDKALVESIELAAKRGADLTRQLLGFARRQMLDVQPMTLNDAITDCLKLAQRVIPEDIRLTAELRADPWGFKGDPAAVQQVLLNLVTNARDAMPAGGTIVLCSDNVTLDAEFAREHPEVSPGEYVLLTVVDDGHGMSDELRQRIFEPFFTTKDDRGNGLGLAVSYGIVKQLHGHISVQSTPGHGTTFDVYWPRAMPKVLGGPVGERPPAAATAAPLHVLFVEDDELVRSTVTRMLEGLGHQVTAAENGANALEIAGTLERPLDVLVTDVVMPWMNGRELCDRLRELQPDLATVFISGYTENVVLQKGIVKPGVVLLRKPFSSAQLADALARAPRAARKAS